MATMGTCLMSLIFDPGGLEMILAPEASSSGTLRIPATQERDAGIYTCQAVNELGDASAEILLEVGRECTPVATCPAPPFAHL